MADELPWPPSFPPEPAPHEAKGCPPDEAQYDAGVLGSYASKCLWRGFVPFFGEFLIHNVDAPPTAKEETDRLTNNMNSILSEYAKEVTGEVKDVWEDVRRMLDKLTFSGAAVTDLLVLPLQSRLAYLFAGILSLFLLSLALLFSF